MQESFKKDFTYIGIVAILLLTRVLALPIMPLSDTTEGRYADIAKNMADSGDWVTPHLWHNGQYVPFLGKPPLSFWLDAISIKLFGVNEFAVRLPGVIAFAAILGFLWLIVSRYSNRDIAWRAVFLNLSSVVLFISSGLVLVDMILTFGVAGALLAYYAFLEEKRAGLKKLWSITVFVMLAIGFMTKGPVAIVLFGLPVFVWTAVNRRWRDIRHHAWIVGTVLFLALVVPWFWTAEVKNPGFLKYFFINENFLRFVTHQYGDLYGSGHEQTRGTAILLMLIAAGPWSFYAIFRVLQYRKSGVAYMGFNGCKIDFFLCVVLVDVLFWALARQILMTYMFPMVIIFSVWLAILIQHQDEYDNKRTDVFNVHAFVLCLAAAIVIIVASPAISSEKSTKGVLKVCQDFSSSGKQRIYFVRKVPYSAYFYGSDNIVPHAKESVEDSLKAIAKHKGTIGIIDKQHHDDVPEDMYLNIFCLDEYGKYTIFEIR